MALRFQGTTLLVALATLVGTVVLYAAVPKGFLPQQDTGVIVAVTEAAQSASIPRMARLQSEAAEIVQADPAVEGVASFVGAGTLNATPNTGRLTIVLKPRGERPVKQQIEADIRNRLAVGISWAWNYLTFARHARLITGEDSRPPRPLIAAE